MSIPLIDISTGSAYHYTSSFSVPGGSHELLTYYSVKQLYYSLFTPVSGSILTSGSFDNHLESSFINNSRYLNNTGIIFSIPRNLYGTHIEPGSIRIGNNTPYTLVDDGEGNIVNVSTEGKVGNVVYSHGQIMITDTTTAAAYRIAPNQSIKFKSNLPIYTHTYNIKVSDYELNHTLNPTAQSGSTILEYSGSKYVQPSGVYADNVTGSAFQPYITTVGLYNDSNELIAVGKLSQPLPKPADTELTIQVKLDV